MMFTLRRDPNLILAWCDWINVNLQVNSLDTVDIQKLPKRRKKQCCGVAIFLAVLASEVRGPGTDAGSDQMG